MSYFTIPKNARSEEERAQRIADNEAKGFELVRTFEHQKEHKNWGDNGYRIGNEAVFKYSGSSSRMTYSAVMRKCNKEYLEQKEKARTSV